MADTVGIWNTRAQYSAPHSSARAAFEATASQCKDIDLTWIDGPLPRYADDGLHLQFTMFSAGFQAGVQSAAALPGGDAGALAATELSAAGAVADRAAAVTQAGDVDASPALFDAEATRAMR